MTSNVGSSAIAKGRHGSIGFILDDDEEAASYTGMKAMVVEELKNYFRPELLNRIDEIVIFRQLEKAQVSHFLHPNIKVKKNRGGCIKTEQTNGSFSNLIPKPKQSLM